MKQFIFSIIILLGLMTTAPVLAADNDARIDRIERQISLFSTQLEIIKTELFATGRRLNAVDEMEITLLRMEQNLRHMRNKMAHNQLNTQNISAQTSRPVQIRPIMVHATW